MEPAIRTENLVKRFGKGTRAVKALDGVTLDVPRGSVFGLLGPNGAGKTTLVKILLGLVRISEGRAHVLDHLVGDVPVRTRIGYLSEGQAYPEYLTGLQYVRFMAHLSGVPRGVSGELAEARLDEAGLSNARNRRIQGYSKGMQQRMGLAAALVHDPELLFLDEPTDGVDPVGRREIRGLVVREAEAGRTVLLNSHLLSEVDQTCTNIAILNHGRLIASGPTAEVRREALGSADEVAYRIETTESATAAMQGFPGRIEKADDGARMLRVFLPSDGGATAAIDHLRAKGIGLRAVVPLEATLEDRFIALIEQDNEARFGKRP